jgi:NAD(P)-dependent dehydrogenase (short-subunit alcohol dehydrogenase family)
VWSGRCRKLDTIARPAKDVGADLTPLVPAGRLDRPQEVADAVAFLASERAPTIARRQRGRNAQQSRSGVRVQKPCCSRLTSSSGRGSPATADEAFDKLGGVDVLVNNVGDVAREQMSWLDMTEESIDRVLAVDIKDAMACIHEFGKRILDQGHGSIVNIGSTVIVRGSARAPQYAAAKYGLVGATKSYDHVGGSSPHFGDCVAPSLRAQPSRPPCASTSSRPVSSRPRRPWAARTGRSGAATSCAR